jgi:hypothetical protein
MPSLVVCRAYLLSLLPAHMFPSLMGLPWPSIHLIVPIFLSCLTFSLRTYHFLTYYTFMAYLLFCLN